MRNKIIKVTREEYNNIKSKIDLKETCLVEINGRKIPNENSFFDDIEELYNFRTLNGTWGRNWSAFDDLMTDLDWIDYDRHIIAIHS